ncbi:MAG: metalloregulator ArsR/SmtB family transcription factor [Gemmatimonadota bacterium]
MTSIAPTLSHLVQTHKALAHPARLRILAMLRPGELCACQIGALLEFAPSTVSVHLAILRQAGLVAERKDGRWVHYRLGDKPETLRLLASLWPRLVVDPVVRSDASVLRQLRKIDVAELCSRNLHLSRMDIVGPVPPPAGART